MLKWHGRALGTLRHLTRQMGDEKMDGKLEEAVLWMSRDKMAVVNSELSRVTMQGIIIVK